MRNTGWSLVCCAGLVACSPSLDWRELRTEDTALIVTWPCKPRSHARTVTLAGQAVRWTLYACEAGGATWGLGWTSLSGPDQVPPAMEALKLLASQNWGGALTEASSWLPPGATPFATSARFQVQGKDPKGSPLRVEAAVFAQGPVVVQATVMGPASAEARQAWWSGLRMNP